MQRIKTLTPIAVGALLGAVAMSYLGSYLRRQFPEANWYVMFAADIITFIIDYSVAVMLKGREKAILFISFFLGLLTAKYLIGDIGQTGYVNIEAPWYVKLGLWFIVFMTVQLITAFILSRLWSIYSSWRTERAATRREGQR